jgi:hypothetical protein
MFTLFTRQPVALILRGVEKKIGELTFFTWRTALKLMPLFGIKGREYTKELGMHVLTRNKEPQITTKCCWKETYFKI